MTNKEKQDAFDLFLDLFDWRYDCDPTQAVKNTFVEYVRYMEKSRLYDKIFPEMDTNPNLEYVRKKGDK